MIVSTASQAIMDNRFANLGIDINKTLSHKFLPFIEENMRLAQIELINSYYDDMSEVEKARAKRTLKAIGGDDLEVAL